MQYYYIIGENDDRVSTILSMVDAGYYCPKETYTHAERVNLQKIATEHNCYLQFCTMIGDTI